MRCLRLAVLLSLSSFPTAQSSADTISTGTGFAVTFDGVVVTNHHVVNGCGAIRARAEGTQSYYHEASVLALDPLVDLAAIRLTSRVEANGKRTAIRAVPRAVLRGAPPLQLGEQAVAFGFPLKGLLASDGNLAVGYLTALRGLGDNPNFLQISTPVQQGGSGSALLDSSGNVIGVVSSKLDALAIMRTTGDVPQNVNFAVELAALRRFLARNSVEFHELDSAFPRPMTEIASRARMFTYLIECDQRPKA